MASKTHRGNRYLFLFCSFLGREHSATFVKAITSSRSCRARLARHSKPVAECVSLQRTSASSPLLNRSSTNCGFHKALFRLSARRSVSRVLSRRALRAGMAIHLGRSSPNASRDRPERRRGRPARQRPDRDTGRLPLLLGLAPGGVCPAAAVAGGAVRSYRTISPLPPMPSDGAETRARRCVFCGTFPGVAPAGRYPAPCLRGARTFLPPADRKPEGERPSDRLAWDDMGCAPISANRPGESQARRARTLTPREQENCRIHSVRSTERANRTRPRFGIRRRTGTATLFAADLLRCSGKPEPGPAAFVRTSPGMRMARPRSMRR